MYGRPKRRAIPSECHVWIDAAPASFAAHVFVMAR
jgi:hypothetical protein